jgi:transcriptional regulator with XRE-family HTH domain
LKGEFVTEALLDVSSHFQAREQAGLTQEQLATRMHAKESAISRIENHAENIGSATLEKYAAALGKRVTATSFVPCVLVNGLL